MDGFKYKHGSLFCESVDIRELAKRQGTPLYVYSRETLVDHYARLHAAFAKLNPLICFSVKSCHNLAILRILCEQGSSFDIVSGGELARVLEIGADPARIVYAGVGKTDAELNAALAAGIGWFNVESEEELENISGLAMASGQEARVALRINPDVDPHTHIHTTTGLRETKFGVDLERARAVFRRFRDRKYVTLDGLHLHLGSPVNTVDPYVKAIKKSLELVDELRAEGMAINSINIGGGFGAHYDGSEAPPASAYAEQIVPMLMGRGLQVLLEPGRCIAANAGVLVTRVLYTKSSGDKRFVIVDGSMTDLLRPALYGSFHFAWPVEPQGGQIPDARRADLRMAGTERVDVVGPVCESGDFLAKDRWLPPVKRGDLICLYSAGAYGAVMGSQYNSRLRPAEILVEGAGSQVIRRRETYDDLVATERELTIAEGRVE